MIDITLDPETHIYTLPDGRHPPSVSEILRVTGLSKDFSGISDFYKDRGSAIHQAIHYFLKGTLDESSLDPVIVPYFEGFKAFLDDYTIDPVIVERPLYNEEMNFAGTPDCVTEDTIYDWKCSKAHDRVAELQGQAYKWFFDKAMKFSVVQFPGDGSFKLFEYGYDNLTWPHIISVFNWKTKRT